MFLALLFNQCRKTEVVEDFGYYYYPLKVDKYWIYEVDSIVYGGFSNNYDSFHYEIKLVVDTMIIDNEGENSYRIAHYVRTHQKDWKFYLYSTVKRNKLTAEQVIYNKRLAKLNFPVEDYNQWDVNAFNTDEVYIVSLRNKGKGATIDSAYYENTITLTHDERDFISEEYTHEIYAKNIGLITQKYKSIETQNGKKKGSAYSKTLIETNWP